MAVKTKQKIWNYTYTFQISFVGQMSKAQFVEDISSLTCDSKNFIRARISETFNAQDIVAAKANPGRIIRTTS